MAIDLTTLNAAQLDAVLFTEGPVLVIAGPGSGKTASLTRRIAYLVDQGFAHPDEILAITFTNKAAGEMKERLAKMLGSQTTYGMWVSTFHSLGVRILRQDAHRLGWTKNFTIYDADDAKRLIKRLLKEAGFEEGEAKPSVVARIISKAKNDLTEPSEFGGGPADHAAVEIWGAYNAALKKANAFDFDDLLGKTHELLANFEEVRTGYQNRFRYVHIDEYQDTNPVQENIARLLAGKRRNLLVVGDDGQSVYAFRSAKIEYILGFKERWPEAITIKLERNYRSTGHIVNAVNSLIAHNEVGMKKDLFTELPAGHRVRGILAKDDRDEAFQVTYEIERLIRDEHMAISDFAVFYRTNAQSRLVEEAFLRRGLDYKIVGGTRYFDRAEVRDVMAYLKAIANPADGISLRRVVNVPRRGIGDTTLSKMEAAAKNGGGTLWDAMHDVAYGMGSLPKKASESVGEFVVLMERLREKAAVEGTDVARVVESIVEGTGLAAAHDAEGTDEAGARADNVREFVSVAVEFSAGHPGATLEDFVEWLALRTDLDEVEEGTPHAVLMTVHTAKGLEFPGVFVLGLEEEVFPHINSINEGAAQLEEERRLAYVAMSRAERRLYLLRASQRMTFGQIKFNKPSRFLSEIPPECLEAAPGFTGDRGGTQPIFGDRGRDRTWKGNDSGRGWSGGGSRASDRTPGRGSLVEPATPTAAAPRVPTVEYKKGDRVSHKVFGSGTVMVGGKDAVEVRFDKDGVVKKLMPAFAPMERV